VELMTCIANFFDPMPDGEYLVMELGSMFGSYQLYIPEDIPNVTCAVNVYSYLDVQGEGTQAPPQQVVTVNGHTTGIDFLYLSLDGGIEGTLADGLGNPVGYGAFYLTGVDDPDFEDYFLGGDDGVFNRGLIDGTYDLMILAVGYETYETQITISGSYLQLNIVLETTTIDENSQVAPKLSVSNYPNPFSATNTIDVKSDVVTNTVIDIYDIKGRKVKQLFNGTLRAGVNSFKWEATKTPSGVYFWKVTTDTETLTEKILLVK
ncbi:MAG: T9SS type A sorting domain-containing protein, partial [Candidatus Zophobacter franzmannii]|nr:T9SS type A sorting domain-containing protein [Candidatus Zophobacter franzmannii]